MSDWSEGFLPKSNIIDEALMLSRNNDKLPMRFSYGPRYNPETNKMDSQQLKDIGFYGPITVGPGDIASEYSTGSDIGEYPSIAKNMPKELLAQALSAAAFHQPVTEDANRYAEETARKRLISGISPFYDPKYDPYPEWSPNQYWEKPAIYNERADGGAVDKWSEGSRNYVVFDDNLINILRKYAFGGAVDPIDDALRIASETPS